jgi:dienelactone hydrolase
MGVSRFVVRLSVLALAALGLGACATQRSDDVLVGIGSQMPEPAKARDYAALYAPYAMMATIAYSDENVLTKGTLCPDLGKLADRHLAKNDDDYKFQLIVRKWVIELNQSSWHCMSGVVGALPCPKRLGAGCRPVGGLEFHVWQRMNGNRECREVAIAFRGSDKNDRGDWTSNFRWLYRLTPKFDQYAQVQDHIAGIIEKIKHDGCGAGAQFVSTGHSLGGGLAQQAAYADRTIRYVYGFDPSPVTGFFDVSAMLRERTTTGLGVDRAYEQGEILMLPRLLAENIFPPAPCHPRIRTVRFNVLSGLPAVQHSIADLTEQLRVASRTPGADAKRVAGIVQAKTCDDMPMMIAPPA